MKLVDPVAEMSTVCLPPSEGRYVYIITML